MTTAHRNPLSRARSAVWRVTAVAVASVLLLTMAAPSSAQTGVVTDPADGVPRTETPIEYDRFPAVLDPGLTAPGYFQPFWYDTDGRHIQAHGGQIVTVEEAGQTVHYWYGEDRTQRLLRAARASRVYRSTDTITGPTRAPRCAA